MNMPAAPDLWQRRRFLSAGLAMAGWPGVRRLRSMEKSGRLQGWPLRVIGSGPVKKALPVEVMANDFIDPPVAVRLLVTVPS